MTTTSFASSAKGANGHLLDELQSSRMKSTTLHRWIFAVSLIALAACGGDTNTENSTTSVLQTTTTVEDRPTWSFDESQLKSASYDSLAPSAKSMWVFDAPYVQTACDVIRVDLKQNEEGSSGYEKAMTELEKLLEIEGVSAWIASGGTKKLSTMFEHFWIMQIASVVRMNRLEYWTGLGIDGWCQKFGFTEENTRFSSRNHSKNSTSVTSSPPNSDPTPTWDLSRLLGRKISTLRDVDPAVLAEAADIQRSCDLMRTLLSSQDHTDPSFESALSTFEKFLKKYDKNHIATFGGKMVPYVYVPKFWEYIVFQWFARSQMVRPVDYFPMGTHAREDVEWCDLYDFTPINSRFSSS